MKLDIYELSAKALVGEELTADEKKTLQDYNTKYTLVRYLVMEKRKSEGFDLRDFQFTPGDEFQNTPTIDIVNSIIKSFSFDAKEIVFGDSHLAQTGKFGNPPVTGKPKTRLGE